MSQARLQCVPEFVREQTRGVKTIRESALKTMEGLLDRIWFVAADDRDGLAVEPCGTPRV